MYESTGWTEDELIDLVEEPVSGATLFVPGTQFPSGGSKRDSNQQAKKSGPLVLRNSGDYCDYHPSALGSNSALNVCSFNGVELVFMVMVELVCMALV